MRNALNGIALGAMVLGLAACGGGGSGSQAPAIIQVPVFAPIPPATVATPAVVDNTGKLVTNLSVRQNGVDYYQSGMYIVVNNNWGADKFGMVYGKDYTQTVTYNKLTMPDGTLFTWDYPDQPYGDGAVVYGYPSVAFGKTTLGLTGYNTENALSQVKNITKFSETFDVMLSGDLKYMNLMSDLFFFDHAGKIAAEITFNIHPSDHIIYWSDSANYFGQQPGAHNHQITMNGVLYDILVSTDPTGTKAIIITPEDNKTKITMGTIDWVKVFDVLDDDLDIRPEWYVKGVELGVEVQAGNGSMLVNDFSVVYTYLDVNNSYVTLGQ